MDNSYYILAKEQIEVKRLHICTWDFFNSPSYIEYGMEFSHDSFHEDSLELYLAVPFIKKGDKVLCLLNNLSNKANSRFIFNDVVNGNDNVGKDERDGSILKFESRETLTILPCETDTDDGLIIFKIKKPNRHEGNLYFRVLVKLEKNIIAIRKNGIAQTSYTYDFKINETRNLPDHIYELKKSQSLEICKVGNLFCLHAVPDSFVFNYIDSSKLKNIRKLETEAFKRYLPDIKSISKDCYNIIFLKDFNKESYSLFSTCTEEMIGAKQIALGIGANILCSLLFTLSSLRFIKDPNIEWYRQIPWEYWGALAILIFLCIYLFTPLKKKF
jgi:hypothetical protein